MFCRPCQREHDGRECAVDQHGNPSMPLRLPGVREAAQLYGFPIQTTVSTTTGANITVWLAPATQQPPPDLPPVGALVRR